MDIRDIILTFLFPALYPVLRADIPADPNPYEAACDRFNRISEHHKAISMALDKMAQWVDDEYEAAVANLRQYESQPGIPLPQYRMTADQWQQREDDYRLAQDSEV